MGIISRLIEKLFSDQTTRQQQKSVRERPRTYTGEEFAIMEQEQSGETWHGVPLSELSKLANSLYRGKYVSVDDNDYLVFYYTSKSGKTNYGARYKLDESKQLERLPHNYYHNQWRDIGDTFFELVKERFSFK